MASRYGRLNRKGSKRTSEITVGVMNGKPALQVNSGGRVYGTQLTLIGSGGSQDSLNVGGIESSGNITFGKNNSLHNSGNRVVLMGGLTDADDGNMAIGDFDVLSSVTSGGDNNLAVGIGAGKNITTGDHNLCMGVSAGEIITTAGSNVTLGSLAGSTGNDAVLEGGLNVYIGQQAGRLTTGTYTGTQNICVGYLSGSGHGTSFEANTCIGKGTLAGSNGEKNIAIGFDAGNTTAVNGANNILIGDTTSVSASDATNQVVIGNGITGTANYTTLIGQEGTPGNIVLDATGDIELNADGGNITLKDGSGVYTPSATSDATTKAYVDTGDETSKYYYSFISANFYNTGVAAVVMLPLNGYTIEQLSPGTSGTEFFGLIAPYNGILVNVKYRSELQLRDPIKFELMTSGDGTELPTTVTGTLTRTWSGGSRLLANTYDTADFTGTLDSGANTVTKGNIIAIRMTMDGSGVNDCLVMTTWRYDITT